VVYIKSHNRLVFSVMLLILFVAAPTYGQIINLSKYSAFQSQVEKMAENRTVVIVEGGQLSMLEKAYLSYAKDQYPEIVCYPADSDNASLLVNASNITVLLIGGPTQNRLAKEVISREDLKAEDITLDIGRATMLKGVTGYATNYVILSDFSGYTELQKTAPAKSPLAKVIPVEFVPLAVGAIVITLLWLYNLLINISQQSGKGRFTKYVMDHVKKKKYNEESAGFGIFGLEIRYREWIAVFSSAVIFSLSVSYMYLIEQGDLIMFILVNIIINVVIQLIKHFIRLALDYYYHVKSEYTLWYFGAFITLVSGWLGNTFSLAGYMVRREDDETLNAKRQNGKNEFWTAMFLGVVVIVFFRLSSSFSSHILQMIWVLCLTALFIDLLPIKPFNGKTIRAWSKSAWWLLFIPVTLVYLLKILLA
jgi:hypothetical protein